MSVAVEPYTISAAVGREGKNDKEDVGIVREMLTQVGFESRPLGPPLPAEFWQDSRRDVCINPPPVPKFDAGLVRQIEAFQRLSWPKAGARPDPVGTVKAGGVTLQRLQVLIEGLTLKPIRRVSVGIYDNFSPFGYEIKYEGEVPLDGPYTLWLKVSANEFDKRVIASSPYTGLDVTSEAFDCARNRRSSLITSDNFLDFMEILDEQALWTSSQTCRQPRLAHAALFVENKRTFDVVSVSNSVSLECPVEPWHGSLTGLVAQSGPAFDLWYNKSFIFTHKQSDRDFPNRISSAVNGNYYFVSERDGARLAVRYDERALNCSNFIAGLFQVSPATKATQSSATLAAKIKRQGAAESTGLNRSQVKDFFKTNDTGYYMIRAGDQPGGHCALVVDGSVYEFTAANDDVIKQNGLIRTPSINDWSLFAAYPNLTYTITPLPQP